MALVEIVNESRMGRLPTKKLLGQRARGGVVERDEEGEEAEISVRLFGRDTHDRNVQVAPDCPGDLAEGDALVADGV